MPTAPSRAPFSFALLPGRHWVHAGFFHRFDGGGRHQESKQRLGGVRLLGTGGNAGRIDGWLLNFGWNWPDDVNARHRAQRADRLKADLRFTTRNHLSDRLGRDHAALVLDLIGDAKALEHFGRDIDATGTVGIGDGFRREQRLFECGERADVGFGCAGAYRHVDENLRQIDAVALCDLALRDQLIDRVADHDDGIDWLAARDPMWDSFRRFAHR